MMTPDTFYALQGSPFGNSEGYDGFHTGTDFPWPEWTPIPMFARGVVIAKGRTTLHGNYVVILVGSRYFQFCHLVEPSALLVGSIVQFGQTIGYVGETGDTTGPHLHLAASTQAAPGTGTRVDPLPIVLSLLANVAAAILTGRVFPADSRSENTMLVFAQSDGPTGLVVAGNTYVVNPGEPLTVLSNLEYRFATGSGIPIPGSTGKELEALISQRGLWYTEPNPGPQLEDDGSGTKFVSLTGPGRTTGLVLYAGSTAPVPYPSTKEPVK